MANIVLKFSLILLVVLCLIVVFYKTTIRSTVLSNTTLTEIDSITHYTQGKPQTLVIGSDKNGKKN